MSNMKMKRQAVYGSSGSITILKRAFQLQKLLLVGSKTKNEPGKKVLGESIGRT